MQDDTTTGDGGREAAHRELARLQRRRLWLSVLLPVLILLSVVIAMAGTALWLRSPAQVAVLSDSMLTVLVLCPLAICMLPILLLSFALIALAARLHSRTRSPLRRLEGLTAMVEGKVEIWLGQVDGRVLDWAVRWAPLRQMLTMFDAPEAESEEEGDE